MMIHQSKILLDSVRRPSTDMKIFSRVFSKVFLYIFGDNEKSHKFDGKLREVLNKHDVHFSLNIVDLAKAWTEVPADIIVPPILTKSLPPLVKQIIGQFSSK